MHRPGVPGAVAARRPPAGRAMTNPAGRKYEVRVVGYLSEVFPGMDRDRKRGRFDKGEFINTGDWTLECKNTKEIRWSEALAEAEAERAHNGTRWCAAIINRKNHELHKGYVLMTLEQLRDLIAELEGR